MSARKALKAPLAAAVLCGGLALSACGSQQGAAASAPAPSAVTASPSASPANVPTGYTTQFDTTGLPQQWQGAPGWKLPDNLDLKKVFSLGTLVAYLIPQQGTGPGQLQVVDGSGTVVYSSTVPKDIDSASDDLYRVTKGGKVYLVYAVSGSAKKDPSSVANAAPVTAVTVLGEDGKVVSSGTLPNVVRLIDRNGLIVASAHSEPDDSDPTQELDLLTGKLVPITVSAGFHFLGASDGVKLYGRTHAFSDKGEVTNGTWSVPADTEGDSRYDSVETTAAPVIFGKYVEVKLRKVANGYPGGCAVFDASTGAKVPMGALEGKCFKAAVSSPSGTIISAEDLSPAMSDVPKGIYSIGDGKSFPITPAISFKPLTITDKGQVYAESGAGIALLDLPSGKDPQVLSGVEKAPLLVTDGGLGVFDRFVVTQKR